MDDKTPKAVEQLRMSRYRHIDEHIYLKRGGMWFGIIFGLSFALMVWGRYIYALRRNAMVMPWLEIIAGLSLCGFLWAMVGYLSGFVKSTSQVVLISIIAAFATPWLVWLAKILNENWVWFLDRRNWSFRIHLGNALMSRLFFIGLWGIGIGAFSGVLQRWLIPHAWDLTTSKGRTTLKSLGVFLLCLPLTILFGSITYDMIHQDFQETLTGVYQGFKTMNPDDPERPFMTWRMGKEGLESNSTWEWPRGEFIIQFVDYDANTMDQFFFDLIYPDGAAVRCQGGSGSMQFCGNVSDTYRQLMEILIRSGLNQQYDGLQCEICDPALSAEVILSLDALGSNFIGSYQIHKAAQYGGAVSMMAHFDSGYDLSCHFRGEMPIVVESCTGGLSIKGE
jgi:hypothetical protein